MGAFIKELFFTIISKKMSLVAACTYGSETSVEMLLKDGADPSANGNEAIILASSNGHVAIVDRLLQDPRVDPTVNDNKPIKLAGEHKHTEVIDRLLQDPRVKPYAPESELTL